MLQICLKAIIRVNLLSFIKGKKPTGGILFNIVQISPNHGREKRMNTFIILRQHLTKHPRHYNNELYKPMVEK
jgi:hypothetical protein